MDNLIAAKILLKGMIDSTLKRDYKTFEEIIESCQSYAKTCDVSQSELKRVSEIRLCDLIGDSVPEPPRQLCPICGK